MYTYVVCVCIYINMRDLWDILDYGKTNLVQWPGKSRSLFTGKQGTERLASHLPSRWNQPEDCRVSFVPVL